MRPTTVLAPIKRDHVQPLRDILSEINDDLAGNPYWHLPASQLSHYVRVVIVSDPDNGPRLLLSADHDGTLEEYVREMVSISPGLDKLWSMCVGYESKDDFTWFIRRNLQRGQDIFVGFPKQTVQNIRAQAAVRQQIEGLANLKEVGHYVDSSRFAELLDLIAQIASPPGPLSVLKQRLEDRVKVRLESARQVAVSASLQVAHSYGQLGMPSQFPHVPNTQFDPATRRLYLQHMASLDRAEDRFAQNQMTLMAEIKVGSLTQLRLRFAMLLAAYVITYGWPPGEFSGVFTLHSFHWILADGGKRLLFLSNFDGSPENYLGDFLDKLEWGLNVFYNNCVDYPSGGMSQVYDFYDWIRSHQFPPQIYYTAYPGTVMSILRDQQITAPVRNRFDRADVERWLGLL